MFTFVKTIINKLDEIINKIDILNYKNNTELDCCKQKEIEIYKSIDLFLSEKFVELEKSTNLQTKIISEYKEDISNTLKSIYNQLEINNVNGGVEKNIEILNEHYNILKEYKLLLDKINCIVEIEKLQKDVSNKIQEINKII
jgi:hypothetical protein